MSNFLKENWIRSALGGFFIHLVLGTLYLWGIITVPVTSYLRKYNPDITYDDTILIYATALGVQGCTYILGGIIDKYLGPRRTCLFGGYILIFGIFLSSFVTSLSAMIFTYGVMFGIGLGFCYVPPMSCATFWNPHRKGFITGTIVAGFGGGAFIFQFISTAVLHMGSNNSMSVGNEKNQLVNGYYPPDSNIVQNVPTMFLVLSICYFFCITFGSFLLVEHHNSLNIITANNPTGMTPPHIGSSYNHTNLTDISDIALGSGSGSSGGRYMTLKNDSSSIDIDGDIELNNDEHVRSNNPLHMYQPPLIPQTSPILESNFNTSHSSGNSNNHKNKQQAQDSTKDTSSLLSHHHPQQHGVQLSQNHHNANINNNTAIALGTPINTDDHSSIHDHNNSAILPSLKQQPTIMTAIDVDPLQMIRMPLCWHLTSCFVTTTIGGMYILGMFKVYGVAALSNNDSTITNTTTYSTTNTTPATSHDANDTEVYLSQIGGIASLLNALGRIAWGELGDVLGPMETLMIMSAFFSLVLVTYPLSPLIDGRFGFTLWTFLVFICEGGNFALYMPCVIQLFGIANSSANFGGVATVYALTNFLNIYTLSKLKVSFSLAAHLMGGLTFIGFINICCLRLHVHYYNNKNLRLTSNRSSNGSLESPRKNN